MGLKQLLIEKRSSILERWITLVLESYPVDTAVSKVGNKDRFTDPVGYVLTHEIEALYDGLLQGAGTDQISIPLERIMQIRSVQDFSPSNAVAVIPLLKKAIQEAMLASGVDLQPALSVPPNRPVLPFLSDWFELESRIDRLSLLAFDIYSKYRQRINEIRLNEVRKERDRTLRLLERMSPGTKGRSKPV